jgi:hypothetical protein
LGEDADDQRLRQGQSSPTINPISSSGAAATTTGQ